MSIDLTKTGSSAPLRPGPPPLGVPPAAWLGMLGGLALMGLGVAVLYEAAVTLGLLAGPVLFVPGRGALADVRPGVLLTGAAVALVLLAAALMASALARRPLRAYRVRAGTGVFLMHEDAARLAEYDARRVAGVLRARARVGRRRLFVDLETTGGDGAVAAVESALAQRFSSLDPAPVVRVRAITRSLEASRARAR